MQYLDNKDASNRKAIRLTKYGLLLITCLLFWFSPNTQELCQTLDRSVFTLLNNSLQHAPFWQYFWGYLNHPHEAWLNIVVMASVNILGITTLSPHTRKRALLQILYFWFCFQIILFVTHLIFRDLLDIHRLSPSLIMPAMINLSDLLHLPNLRLHSSYSLPAGHTLIAIYWASFSARYCQAWVRPLIYAITALLILPRLFCGGHWLSDVVFTSIYALICFTLIDTAMWPKSITKSFNKLLNLFGLKQQRTASTL